MGTSDLLRRGKPGARFAFTAIAALVAAVLLAGGCGGGSNSTEDTVQEQIDQARREGAVAAHRRERMAELQRRVARLERRSSAAAVAGQPATAPSVTAPPSESGTTEALRVFHAPSGNVSCAIVSDGATCSVISAGETFVLESGSTAWTEAGSALPEYAGELAPYGSTVSNGSVSCTIPAANEPRGVLCTESGGHGFEASRVEAHQSTF